MAHIIQHDALDLFMLQREVTLAHGACQRHQTIAQPALGGIITHPRRQQQMAHAVVKWNRHCVAMLILRFNHSAMTQTANATTADIAQRHQRPRIRRHTQQ